MERDTNAVGVGSCRDRAFDVATRIIRVEEFLSRESRDIDRSGRVVLDDGRVAKNASDWGSGSLGADASEENSHRD